MELEQEASQMGWKPKEAFLGDPAKWVDAEEFVRRGKTVLPILRKDNERLQQSVGTLTDEVKSLRTIVAEGQAAMEEFRKYHEETEKRSYERALKELQGRRVEAKKAGDVDAELAAEEAIEKLREAGAKPGPTPAPKPPAPPPEPAIHPDYAAWQKDNAVWLAEPAKAAYAQAAATFLRSTGNTLTGRAFLDAVTAEVEQRFGGPAPHKGVEGGSPGGKTSGSTFADLPKEARDACIRQGERLVGPNKAFKSMDDWKKQYARDYFGDER